MTSRCQPSPDRRRQVGRRGPVLHHRGSSQPGRPSRFGGRAFCHLAASPRRQIRLSKKDRAQAQRCLPRRTIGRQDQPCCSPSHDRRRHRHRGIASRNPHTRCRESPRRRHHPWPAATPACTTPGKRYEDWLLDDPAGKDIDAVQAVRDNTRNRHQSLIYDLGQLYGGCAPGDPWSAKEAAKLASARHAVTNFHTGSTAPLRSAEESGRRSRRGTTPRLMKRVQVGRWEGGGVTNHGTHALESNRVSRDHRRLDHGPDKGLCQSPAGLMRFQRVGVRFPQAHIFPSQTHLARMTDPDRRCGDGRRTRCDIMHMFYETS